MPASATQEQPAVVERRRARRSRSLLGARIIYRNGNCSMGCLILDISDDGALLQPDDIFLCPETFELKPRTGLARKCERAWRRGTKVGVRFI